MKSWEIICFYHNWIFYTGLNLLHVQVFLICAQMHNLSSCIHVISHSHFTFFHKYMWLSCFKFFRNCKFLLNVGVGLAWPFWLFQKPSSFVSVDQALASSVTSPICQEGQSEKNLPDFCLFFPIFPLFSWFFPSSSRFLANFSLSGVALCPLAPQWLRQWRLHSL